MSDSVRSPLRDHSPSTEINDKDDGLFGSDEEDAGPSKQPQDPDGNGNAREDDLFGASDEEGNDENDDEDDDEEETIKRPARQRLRVGSRSGTPQETATPTRRINSTTPDTTDFNAALEHRETSAEPPMGTRDVDDLGTSVDIQEASFSLPSLPVRRGAAHFYARLPNLLQYRSEVFDKDSFDDKAEDELLQGREGVRIDDQSLRSLLISSNTIRWRWSESNGTEGVKVPQSNARIVRWSDGSSSLQLGSEFYDISLTSEKPKGGQGIPSESELVPPQPAQHLNHVFVKHDGQDQVNVYQAEAPVMGSMMFRPTSITSESHQRLAKAVRKQKGSLVKETLTREDPELEKERKEREDRKAQQKRARELRKKSRTAEEDDDDAFWANARTTRRVTAGQHRARDNIADELLDEDVDGDDNDGFVVDDDDSQRDEGKDSDDMDVDVEDDIDRMEAKMENQEAQRRAQNAGDTSAAGRRRRILEESDEE